ncbi:MAG: toll/interleukin-1 receptor domain-containing protein, partial [Planctomycetaceae bacterium]
HLPAASEEQLQQHFDGGLADLNEQKQLLLRPRMHKLDWQRFLTLAGSTYGADAKYCRDGLSFRTKQGQSVLILCDLDQQAGFGGTLQVHVAGPDSADLLQQVTQQLRAVIPDELDVPSMTADRKLGAGVPREQVRPEVASVFLSYAWNSNEQPPFEYEDPVNKIEELLLKHGCRTGRSQSADAGGLQVLRDKHSMTAGESIVEFMRRGAKATKIILIHSRRYWESPHCLYELWKMRDAVLDSEEKSFAKTVIPVELENSGIRDAGQVDKYR